MTDQDCSQAHEAAITCMRYSHNENWLVTSDGIGHIKYWKGRNELVKVQQHFDRRDQINFGHACPPWGLSFLHANEGLLRFRFALVLKDVGAVTSKIFTLSLSTKGPNCEPEAIYWQTEMFLALCNIALYLQYSLSFICMGQPPARSSNFVA